MDIRTEIDISTGIEITPEHPELCKGNPECCDECDYLEACVEKDKDGRK